MFRNNSFQGERKRMDFRFLKQLQMSFKVKRKPNQVLQRQSSSVLQINYKGTQTPDGCAKPALSSQDYRFRHTPHLVPKPAQVEKLHRSLCRAKKPMRHWWSSKALKSCTVSSSSAESHCCLSCTTGSSVHLATQSLAYNPATLKMPISDVDITNAPQGPLF